MKMTLRSLLLLCFFACVATVLAQNPVPLAPLDAKVGKALEAYNRGDHTAFFGDYAKSMASIATEQVFNAQYRGTYFTSYGKYLSRVLLKDATVAAGDTPLLVYVAEFEKNKKVKISVNFATEQGVLKIVQIQFAGM